MVDAAWLASTLEDVPAKITGWRDQATQLRHLVTAAEVAGTVSDELLLTTERTATLIYDEISKTKGVITSVAETSPAAASQLAALDDTLHLLLLEITELSTELYAVRSRLVTPAQPLLAHS